MKIEFKEDVLALSDIVQLDSENCMGFSDEVMRLIVGYKPKVVEFDFSLANQVDATGLSLLLFTYKAVKDSGRLVGFKILYPNSEVRKLLAFARIDQIFEVV